MFIFGYKQVKDDRLRGEVDNVKFTCEITTFQLQFYMKSPQSSRFQVRCLRMAACRTSGREPGKRNVI